MNRDELAVALESDLRSDEGYSSTAYTDTQGKLTVGYGFNLDDPAAEVICNLYGLNYQGLRNGDPMTRAQAEVVLGHFIGMVTGSIDMLIPNFWSLCDGAQRAAGNMYYNLGRTRFSGFHMMLAALVDENYAEAARQMQSSAWYTQVKQRAVRLVALMNACA